MEVSIQPYTKDRIEDVLSFEAELRRQEDVWGWDIDEAYVKSMTHSFDDPSFNDAVSFLAYADGKVVGRIDGSIIKTRFDGTAKGYLDWICVLQSHRHNGIAQHLLDALKEELKLRGINTLIALTASNEEAQRFYLSIPDSEMHDVGIWIEIK